MKKFAIILSGCGVYDGAEIHEATLSMLAIAKNNATYEIFAPDIQQHHVINHITGEEMQETRNVLVESARIARGKIRTLTDFSADAYDGLLIPGGFGAAKNLSDWAFNGPGGNVLPEVARVIREMADAGKPIGALCISPVLIVKTLEGARVTIGSDSDTAGAIEKTGATHVTTTHGEVVMDERYNLFTTPCYMLDATITQIADGAGNIVKAMLERMR